MVTHILHEVCVCVCVASSISAPVFLPEVMLGVTLFGFLLGVGQNVDIYGYIFKELCVIFIFHIFSS